MPQVFHLGPELGHGPHEAADQDGQHLPHGAAPGGEVQLVHGQAHHVGRAAVVPGGRALRQEPVHEPSQEPGGRDEGAHEGPGLLLPLQVRVRGHHGREEGTGHGRVLALCVEHRHRQLRLRLLLQGQPVRRRHPLRPLL